MKSILGSLLIALFSLLLMQWLPLPWFTPIIIAFVFGLLLAKWNISPFLMGSLGLIVFWTAKSIPSFLVGNGAYVSKWANLFTEQLNLVITPIILLILTAVFGGLLGGLSALSGYLFVAPNQRRTIRLRNSKTSSTGKSYKLKLNKTK